MTFGIIPKGDAHKARTGDERYAGYKIVARGRLIIYVETRAVEGYEPSVSCLRYPYTVKPFRP